MRVYGKNVAKEMLNKNIRRAYLAKTFNDFGFGLTDSFESDK